MKIYFAPAPTANYTKKKVWSRSFIWMEVLVNLESNKQYPHTCTVWSKDSHTNTSDECYCFP